MGVAMGAGPADWHPAHMVILISAPYKCQEDGECCKLKPPLRCDAEDWETQRSWWSPQISAARVTECFPDLSLVVSQPSTLSAAAAGELTVAATALQSLS